LSVTGSTHAMTRLDARPTSRSGHTFQPHDARFAVANTGPLLARSARRCHVHDVFRVRLDDKERKDGTKPDVALLTWKLPHVKYDGASSGATDTRATILEALAKSSESTAGFDRDDLRFIVQEIAIAILSALNKGVSDEQCLPPCH